MAMIVLDDARAGRLRVFERPCRTISVMSGEGLGAAIEALRAAKEAGLHVAGYVSYELGYLLEDRLRPLLPATGSRPLLWFGAFAEAPVVLEGEAADGFWRCAARAYAGRLVTSWDEAAYRVRFDRVQELIRAGDIFQANLTMQAEFRLVGSPRALYAALRREGGGARSAFVDDGARQILSCSPELFVAIDEDGRACSEPMKGTAPRGSSPARDRAARAALAASMKDRAENLMIVDLVRNDLGRIATLGSVSVDRLFAVETLPTVHQMTSRVSARLVPGIGIEDVLRALFPCGSIVGAPKIRAMEILSELEATPRGVYCGAIGEIAPDGAMTFSVAIRTATIENGRGTIGIGGAVTIGSTARSEWAECLLKAAFFERARRPLALVETLRHERGVFVRRTLHLARMRDSARAFGLPFDEDAATRALAAAVAGIDAPLRVRLVLDEDGRFDAGVERFVPAAPGTRWRFAISPHRVASDDRLLWHKTSWRDLYDGESARARDELGADEVVFLNERGQLCEGARTNLFLMLGGELLTPAQSCGLLDGCLRHELLDTGRAREAVLDMADLDRADGVMLGNSLRGLVSADRCGWRVAP